jgi:hypothetical protein
MVPTTSSLVKYDTPELLSKSDKTKVLEKKISKLPGIDEKNASAGETNTKKITKTASTLDKTKSFTTEDKTVERKLSKKPSNVEALKSATDDKSDRKLSKVGNVSTDDKNKASQQTDDILNSILPPRFVIFFI